MHHSEHTMCMGEMGGCVHELRAACACALGHGQLRGAMSAGGNNNVVCGERTMCRVRWVGVCMHCVCVCARARGRGRAGV